MPQLPEEKNIRLRNFDNSIVPADSIELFCARAIDIMMRGIKKQAMYATVMAVTILKRRMFASSILCKPFKFKDSQ
jgi:hypothetical protein